MIQNKKIYYEYNVLEEFEVGIKLKGSEVKQLKDNNASILNAYCYFNDNELFVKNINIAESKRSGLTEIEGKRDRKLLLKKQELNSIQKQLKLNKGLTIFVLSVFEKNNFIKIKIGVCKHKKNFEKRDKIKKQDIKRDTEKQLLNHK